MNMVDQITRDRALDITTSFIVQAPAGSGKTALLTQRILALLGQVNEPEECLAITFTRKAAAEMRARILLAISDAYHNKSVFVEYDLKTRRLANQVLARDKVRNWQLFDNPNRLKIQTIDSLNVSLTKRMPVLSGFGAQPKIVMDANELYTLAVNAVLDESMVPEHYMPALSIVLQHLDNNREFVKKMFTALLPLREQWLPYIMQTQDSEAAKAVLEFGLKTVVTDFLQQLVALIPNSLQQLPNIAAQAARYLQNTSHDSAITNCINLTVWPGAKLTDLTVWQGIAELLTTKEGQLRKTVSQAQGFPAPSLCKNKMQKEELVMHKQSMLEILIALQKHGAFCETLSFINHLPPLEYSAQQWQFMASLVQILPLLVAQLTIIFRERGQIDLPEVSIAARMALGGIEAPSDLALALDSKISHILVDEFQDTSIAQFRLLEQLILGWMPGDGRTLFLVGDPMQSIYRFRQAEVGLFANAQQYGIGGIKLESLYLTANFRSAPQIIAWVNAVFKGIFPKTNNITLGEVAYSDSMATSNNEDGVVAFTCFKSESDIVELRQIITTIKMCQQQHPHETIAILVRSRSHLPRLLVELKAANIVYQGVEIESLANNSSIQDLLALTKALLHLSDRISWLAILRAPWCGLTLQDLHALVSDNLNGCVWESMQAFEQCKTMSAAGQQRLNIVVPIIANAIAFRDKYSLMELVYSTWRALSAELCLQDEQSLEDVHVFFELLRLHDNNKNIFEIGFWERQLARLFSKPKNIQNNAVQIMTIHKAKGLEFDTVILPSLDRQPIVPEARLFRWEERTSLTGRKHLIFAPISAVGEDDDLIYKFLKYTDKISNHYELARLLYVATTRAKKALFGFASNSSDKAPTNSMLGLIADYVAIEDYTSETKKPDVKTSISAKILRRLPMSVMVPVVSQKPWLPVSNSEHEYAINSKHDSYDGINDAVVKDVVHNGEVQHFMRQIGIVVHKTFWQMATFGVELWQQIQTTVLVEQWTILLMAEGVPYSKVKICLDVIQLAVTNILHDSVGRWILNDTHNFAKAEWELTAVINKQVKQVVIDRIFIDHTGICWIIDYKTCNSFNNAAGMVESTYIKQLKLYQQILYMLFPDITIKTALYFSLQSKFQEIV